MPQPGRGPAQWVLSRALCRYVRIGLKDVPPAQRGGALTLQIAQWSPYAQSGSHVVWHLDDALVWIWDASVVESAIRDAGLDVRRVAVLPETLLHPEPGDGLHLVACMEGYEGQYWNEGVLRHARWWPRVPDRREWQNFQRDASVAAELQQSELPPAGTIAWLDRPWAAAASTGAADDGRERTVLLAAAMLLAAPTLWYALGWWKYERSIADRGREMAAAEEKALPMLRARSEALDFLAEVNRLHGIERHPSQAVLMAKVAELLPKNGAFLREWEYVGGKLKFTVVSPDKIESSVYVKAFQDESSLFRDVQASLGADPVLITLAMEIVPHARIVLSPEKIPASVAVRPALPAEESPRAASRPTQRPALPAGQAPSPARARPADRPPLPASPQSPPRPAVVPRAAKP